ncbi:hypothetical protein [Bianquea renquensis]|uniref:Glycosyltransferase n=1 Tax=Bianquea renquensis TaxID=2763661 RepID=A0A926I0Y9_9FIRM|nr:hypothetical protein [Bianquea renquensis]MBC8542720.1 hypothetical protein [Bianquea renquensis]
MSGKFWTAENLSISAAEYRKYMKTLSQTKRVYVRIYTDTDHFNSIQFMLNSASGVIFQFEDIVADTPISDMQKLITPSWDTFLNQARLNNRAHINFFYGDPYKLNVCFAFAFDFGKAFEYNANWEFSNAVDAIPTGVDAYRTVVLDNDTVWIVFSKNENLERNTWKKIHQDDILIFLPPAGYGDLVILLPVLGEYFSKHSDCSFIIYTMDLAADEIIHKTFSGYFIRVVHIPNLYPSNMFAPFYYREVAIFAQYIKQIEASNIYNEVKWLAIDGNQLIAQSAYEFLSNMLDVDPDHALEVYQYHTSQLPILDEIEKLRETKRYVVGLQYQSDTLNLKGERIKDWSVENARQFLVMCKDEQIGVVNLVPTIEKDIKWDINAEYVSILDLFTVIAALDCVVSVDSVSGHIAGITGTNNLTIWSAKSYFYKPLMFAYRPLSKNYTICTEAHLTEIPPKLVFEKLKAILIGNLMLQKKRFCMQGVEPAELTNNIEYFCPKAVNKDENR